LSSCHFVSSSLAESSTSGYYSASGNQVSQFLFISPTCSTRQSLY
jgi:hypothetical protein